MTRIASPVWRRVTLSLALLAPLLLSACGGAQAGTDQSRMCVFSTDAQAKKCKSGELAFFSPDGWGNEQLPLIVIATYCDTNRPVQFNKAGVVCTFTDKRLWLLKDAK